MKFRSVFERSLAAWFRARNIAFNYETRMLDYCVPVPKGRCGACGSNRVLRRGVYLADFSFPKFSFLIEAKGRFTSRDRTKMLAVKAEGHDVRLVFMRDNKLRPQSSTRYSDWARKHGFAYSVGEPDTKWFKRRAK